MTLVEMVLTERMFMRNSGIEISSFYGARILRILKEWRERRYSWF
jgi:hypothetical protein